MTPKKEHSVFAIVFLGCLLFFMLGVIFSKKAKGFEYEMCYWATCTTAQGNISGCWKYGNGTRLEMGERAKEYATKAGVFFFTECVLPGEKPTVVDWNRRVTGLPTP